MAGKKPLIFVYPLSESLQKLKDIMSETSEENGLEIYEVDAAVEAVQLIPTVGQSLTLFSNPKKCAQILQASKKFMSKMNSKAILLSPKQMPRKTLDKFSKVGLTECIVEPVAPKTLLYKVNLIMRSIVAQKEEDDEEFGVKSLNSGEIEEAEGNQKQRMEKGVLDDQDAEDMYAREKKDKTEIELEEEEKKKKESNYSEESIDTDWKGNVEKDELDLESDDEKKKNNYEEEEIETYYKGETKGGPLDIAEEEKEEKEKKEHETQEAGWDDKEEKSTTLDLDEEDEEESNENTEEIDSYMRGKIADASTMLDIEDEEDATVDKDEVQDDKYLKGKINQELMMAEEEELEGVIREDEEDEEVDEEKKKTRHLDLDDDDEDSDIEKEEEDELEEAGKKKKREELELEDAEDHKKERHELEEEEQAETQKEEVEEIEKFYKGKVGEQLDELEEDDSDDEDKANRTELELEEAENYKKEREDYDLEESDDDSKKDKENETEIEFDEDMYDREKLEDEEMENYSKKKNSDLELEDADDHNDYEKDDEDEEDTDSDTDNEKSSLDLDLEDDSDKDKTMGQEDDERGEFGRKESSKDLELEEDGFQKKAKMIEKDIGGHYSNKKSVQHQEYDWENLNNKFNQHPDEEENKKKEENTLTYEGKDDLGEQTIDYSKLWEEFGGITMDREATKSKVTGPKYVAGEKVEDAKTASFYGDDENEDDPDYDAKNKGEDEEEIKPIHEPKPNGLETAVKILNFYQLKDTQPKDVYHYIANIINEEEGGSTSFLTMNKDKNVYEDAYISQLEFDSDSTEQERKSLWQEQKVKNQSRWRELTLPTWSDETFQNKELEFFYPFYEGVSDLGLAVIDFKNGITQDKVKKIEIILETARGLFLEEFHDTGSKGEYDGHENEEKKVGFFKKAVSKIFGGLFGKKKG